MNGRRSEEVRGGGFLSWGSAVSWAGAGDGLSWGGRWIGRVRSSERGQGILKVRDFTLIKIVKKKKTHVLPWSKTFFYFFIFFLFELQFFFLKLKYEVACHVRYFLYWKKTVNHVIIFHLTLNGKDYFDTRLKGWGPIWHNWKIRDQFNTKAKCWRPKRYLNLI